jgi:glycosyltransferase involved in cell wall biosynthesis
MRTVVIVSYAFPPISSPAALRMAKFATYLPDFGWSAAVVTSDNGYSRAIGGLEEPETVAGRVVRVGEASIGPLKRWLQPPTAAQGENEKSNPGEGVVARLKSLIRRLGSTVLIPDREIFWLGAAARATEVAARRFGAAAVLSTSPNPSNLLVADRAARCLSLPHVVDFRDLWTPGQRHGLRHRVESRWEREILCRAAAALVVSPTMSRQLTAAYPWLEERIHIVPNGFDEVDFAPAAHLRPKSGSRYTLVYAGGFAGGRRDPSVLLRAIRRLRNEGVITPANFRFDVYGTPEPWLSARIAEIGLRELVVQRGRIFYDQVPTVLALADALLVITQLLPGSEGEMTTKLFDYLGARRRILLFAPDHYDIAAIGDRLSLCTRLSPDDEKGAIAFLRGEMAALADGRLDRSAAQDRQEDPEAAYFSRRALSGRLANVLDTVVGTGGA